MFRKKSETSSISSTKAVTQKREKEAVKTPEKCVKLCENCSKNMIDV
jgi:hypothetical protein